MTKDLFKISFRCASLVMMNLSKRLPNHNGRVAHTLSLTDIFREQFQIFQFTVESLKGDRVLLLLTKVNKTISRKFHETERLVQLVVIAGVEMLCARSRMQKFVEGLETTSVVAKSQLWSTPSAQGFAMLLGQIRPGELRGQNVMVLFADRGQVMLPFLRQGSKLVGVGDRRLATRESLSQNLNWPFPEQKIVCNALLKEFSMPHDDFQFIETSVHEWKSLDGNPFLIVSLNRAFNCHDTWLRKIPESTDLLMLLVNRFDSPEVVLRQLNDADPSQKRKWIIRWFPNVTQQTASEVCCLLSRDSDSILLEKNTVTIGIKLLDCLYSNINRLQILETCGFSNEELKNIGEFLAYSGVSVQCILGGMSSIVANCEFLGQKCALKIACRQTRCMEDDKIVRSLEVLYKQGKACRRGQVLLTPKLITAFHGPTASTCFRLNKTRWVVIVMMDLCEEDCLFLANQLHFLNQNPEGRRFHEDSRLFVRAVCQKLAAMEDAGFVLGNLTFYHILLSESAPSFQGELLIRYGNKTTGILFCGLSSVVKKSGMYVKKNEKQLSLNKVFKGTSKSIEVGKCKSIQASVLEGLSDEGRHMYDLHSPGWRSPELERKSEIPSFQMLCKTSVYSVGLMVLKLLFHQTLDFTESKEWEDSVKATFKKVSDVESNDKISAGVKFKLQFELVIDFVCGESKLCLAGQGIEPSADPVWRRVVKFLIAVLNPDPVQRPSLKDLCQHPLVDYPVLDLGLERQLMHIEGLLIPGEQIKWGPETKVIYRHAVLMILCAWGISALAAEEIPEGGVAAIYGVRWYHFHLGITSHSMIFGARHKAVICPGRLALDSQVSADWPVERFFREGCVGGFIDSSSEPNLSAPCVASLWNPKDATTTGLLWDETARALQFATKLIPQRGCLSWVYPV